jgi:hypothetical protein
MPLDFVKLAIIVSKELTTASDTNENAKVD